jgi:hypothetical protein
VSIANKLLGIFLCLILSACSTPPKALTTDERTVRQGSGQVEKLCTENPPPGYTSGMEARLKAELPLAGTTEAQAEGVLKNYFDQHPRRGTERGEDVEKYLFHICQMSNNDGWSVGETERFITLFKDGWTTSKSEAAATPPDPRCTKQLENGYALRERIDNEYWQSRRAGTFLDRRDEFTAKWGEEAGEWAAETRAVLLQIGGPTAKGRFQNAQTPIGMVSGDVKWNNIRNFLRTRLAALESICKAP